MKLTSIVQKGEARSLDDVLDGYGGGSGGGADNLGMACRRHASVSAPPEVSGGSTKRDLEEHQDQHEGGLCSATGWAWVRRRASLVEAG